MCRGSVLTRLSWSPSTVWARPPIPATRTISDAARTYGVAKYAMATMTSRTIRIMRRRRRGIWAADNCMHEETTRTKDATATRTRFVYCETRMKRLVIAIDGPSGAGKGTVSRAIADALGYRHVDTGAMYRAVGWKAVHEGLSLDDEA